MTDTEVTTRRCPQCCKHRPDSEFVSAKPRAKCIACRKRARELSYTVEDGVSRVREYSLWRLYRITPEQYDATREAQGRRCAICNRHEDELPPSRTGRPRSDGTPAAEGFRLAVDHCHDSNRVRGLLCGACNTAIAQVRDSVEVLASAIRYLNHHHS